MRPGEGLPAGDRHHRLFPLTGGKALKNARLVKSRREGKTVFYALADDHVKTIINQGLEHILE